MEPETPTPETSTVAPTVAPVTAPASKVTFTAEQQEQVNAIVRDRLAEAARRAPKQEPAPQPKPEAKAESKSDKSDDIAALRVELENQKLRHAFDKRIAKFDVSDSKAEKLFTLYQASKPADESAWFNETIEEFGLKAPTSPAHQPVTPSGGSAPPAPPPAAPNAPVKVESATAQGLPNPWALTLDQIDQLGPQGCRNMLEQLTTVARGRLGTPPVPKTPARK